MELYVTGNDVWCLPFVENTVEIVWMLCTGNNTVLKLWNVSQQFLKAVFVANTVETVLAGF